MIGVMFARYDSKIWKGIWCYKLTSLQLIDPHHNTKPAVYTGQYVQIPGPDVVPNLDLQVVNYHQPPLGTFHAKFMIVDREIACLSSNNIQVGDVFSFQRPISVSSNRRKIHSRAAVS